MPPLELESKEFLHPPPACWAYLLVQKIELLADTLFDLISDIVGVDLLYVATQALRTEMLFFPTVNQDVGLADDWLSAVIAREDTRLAYLHGRHSLKSGVSVLSINLQSSM